MKPSPKTEPIPLAWVRPALWVVLPLAGVLLLVVGGTVLRQRTQLPASAPSPVTTVTPVQPLALSPSVSPTPTPTATKKPTPKPPLKPIDPSALTAQQKALNQRSKEAFTTQSTTVDSLIEMHIAIAAGQPVINLSTPTGAVLMDQKGRQLHQLPPGAVYEAQPGDQSIRFGEWQLPAIVWLEIPPGGVFQLGDRTYRGRLLLAANSGKLWGVNYINMRQYLYSVVASEVSPSWKMEALKAQAVAARSYALTYYFKPVSPLFHMGADEYYQVYSGIAREASTTSAAVDATAGEFVSYRGDIVESLYAASDDIVAEAFQGKGMSQLGALALAEQGYTYKKILSNYYPSTGVARIEEDKD